MLNTQLRNPDGSSKPLYINVHNHDAVKIIKGEKCGLVTKRVIIKHRIDFLEGLLCVKCGGRGKRYLDFGCKKCNGSGLENDV